MNSYLIISFLLLCTCEKQLFSQVHVADCKTTEKNAKRYEFEEGSLKYYVYSTNGKGKKKNKLFTVNITFKDYGKHQDINVSKSEYSESQSLTEDTSISIDQNKFLLNYFVFDSCSIFYKGINLIKPIEEKYKNKKCLRFIQYRFDDYGGNENIGTVKYCEGVPVYIRGGNSDRTLIWELQDLPSK